MISIVIGAFNEEQRIGQSLKKIHEFLRGRGTDYEIIVVDDGSTDRTSPLVDELAHSIAGLRGIRYEKNRGKGYALRTGVLVSKGDVVLLSDADLSTPIEELDSLYPYLSEYSIAIGSRACALSTIVVKQPWWRQQMGKTFNRVVRLLVMDDFSDTQCGFKLFAGDTARHLFKEAVIDRFAYDVEILALAKKKGYRIAEVPIKWLNDPASKVHPIRDSLKMLIDLLRIRQSIGPVAHGQAATPRLRRNGSNN
jgi:dolichyl-phosphate beta-glucosyltransferase